MAVVPLYKQQGPKERMLDALRRGMTRAEAAEAGGARAGTFAGWVERDAVWQQEVELAEREARSSGTTRMAKVSRDEKTGGDRWRRIKEEATAFGGGMLGFLFAIDARVSSVKGNPPMSPFFRHAFGEFYRGGYREFCMCGGRGTGKSTNQIKIAANELMFRERDIPPMDPAWIWPFMSHNMAESAKRFEPFKRTLMALGFAESELVTVNREDGRAKIKFADVKGQPVEINIFPNTKEACIGGNLAGATHDEELHWQSGETSGKVKLARADDVLEFMAGAFRSDLTRVHIRISALSGMNGPMLDAIKQGSTELRYVPTLGPFLEMALGGFDRVATYLEERNMSSDAARVRSWASRLTADSPWIPAWVGNPNHDAVDGLRLVLDLLPSWRDKVGVWLRENGSCTDPLRAESGDYFDGAIIDAGCAVARIITREVAGRFPAIDTGASRNPSALGIVERVVYEVRTNATRERRYQFRPHLLRPWKRRPGERPLDLRNVVLPEMARIILAEGCVPAWWTDGWSSHDIENVAALFGITTHFISTSTVTADMYEPLDSALRGDPCPVVLSGCDGIEAAVAQLRAVMRAADGKAIVREVGTEHGELGQVLVRALAHAGVGTVPPATHDRRLILGGDRYTAVRRGFRGGRM
jgi:hypothetical protein